MSHLQLYISQCCIITHEKKVQLMKACLIILKFDTANLIRENNYPDCIRTFRSQWPYGQNCVWSWDRSNTGIVVPNLARGVVLCVVLFCVGTALAMGRSLVQRVVLKCLNGSIISEVNSESEQASDSKQ